MSSFKRHLSDCSPKETSAIRYEEDFSVGIADKVYFLPGGGGEGVFRERELEVGDRRLVLEVLGCGG